MPDLNFETKFYKDREVKYPLIKRGLQPPFWTLMTNHLEVLKANQWLKTPQQYQKYFANAYKNARTQGFLRELPLVFARAPKGDYSSISGIRKALLNYQSRSTCPEGLLRAIRRKGVQYLLDERFPTHATQDRDIFYLMPLGEVNDQRTLYKVGVSSFHLGKQRERKFIDEGYQFSSEPMYWYCKRATSVERFALSLSSQIDYEVKFDGYTEHRYLSPKNIEAVQRKLFEYKALKVTNFKAVPDGYSRTIKKINNVVKYKDGYAARENRNKQIAVFSTKFDAVLCKGMHLDGGVLREYALNIKRLSDTPFYQDEEPNSEKVSRLLSQPKKPKKAAVQPAINPVQMKFSLSEDESFLTDPINKWIINEIDNLNKKRRCVHKKDKQRLHFRVVKKSLYSVVGENRYGIIKEVGATNSKA
jgi:hypothetical protein